MVIVDPPVFDLLSSRVVRACFVYLAVFTGLLALDDLFMIHEEILPVRLGIPEVAMYALGFFALSIVTDQLGGPAPSGVGLVVEDLAKMLGVVCWLTFTTNTAVQTLSGGL